MRTFSQRMAYAIAKYRYAFLAVMGVFAFLMTILVLPFILVKPSSDVQQVDKPNEQVITTPHTDQPSKEVTTAEPAITVYLTKEKSILDLPLEQYVRGVVAAEMPIDFEIEALKAQAIAARTYIVRRLIENDRSNVPVKGAIVTDTVNHQVYATDRQLKQKWGMFRYGKNMNKLKQAVKETQGIIITYKDYPINATFFSTSNGYTENSEDYWNVYEPYLRSVESPWDKAIAPRYKETITMKYKDFLNKLGIRTITASATGSSFIRVLERSSGHRITEMKVGNKTYTGREIRERLGLNSSQFTWSIHDSQIAITTYGFGHGVGMSQWGANGMAQAGEKAEDIIQHYYTGIELKQAATVLPSSNPSL